MLLQNLVSVMSLSLLAQAIGFLRTLVIAALFGASINLDAYYLALIVPALVSGIVGGALQGGFVSNYVRLLTLETSERAAALRGSVAWLLVVALPLLSLAITLTAPIWVPLIAAGGGDELSRLAVYASRITALSIAFTCIGDFLGLVLNCHRRFALAAAAPVANTLVSVPVLLVIGPTVTGLAVSVVVGAAAQLLTVSAGVIRCKLTLPLPGRHARADLLAVIDLARPMLPGFVFTQVQMAYLQALPALLGHGAISVFGYTTRLQAVVEQVFVIGLGTVLLPHLAELVARGDRATILRLATRIGIWALCGAVVLAAGIWLAGDRVVQMLLARGHFDVETAAAVARIWLFLALSTFPFTVSTSLSKLIMALGRPGVLSITAALTMVAVYGFAAIGVHAFGLAGVASAVMVAQCLRFLAYGVWLRSYFAGNGQAQSATAWRP